MTSELICQNAFCRYRDNRHIHWCALLGSESEVAGCPERKVFHTFQEKMKRLEKENKDLKNGST